MLGAPRRRSGEALSHPLDTVPSRVKRIPLTQELFLRCTNSFITKNQKSLLTFLIPGTFGLTVPLGRRRSHQHQQQAARVTTFAFLASEHFDGNNGESINDLRQHIWIFHFLLRIAHGVWIYLTIPWINQRRRNLMAKKKDISFCDNLPHEARHESGESLNGLGVYCTAGLFSNTAKGVLAFGWYERTLV